MNQTTNGIPGSAGLYRIFYAITGAGFLALIIGFATCLFDMDRVSECADHSEYAFTVLKGFGDHVVGWSLAFVEEVMSRS